MLTTGVDTVPGSTGTELITGGVTSLSSTDTLQVTDQIDGGAGRDTFNLTLSKNFNGFTVGSGFLKGVETLNITNPTTSEYDFTARGVSDVEALNVTGRVDILGMASLTPVVTFSGLSTSSSQAVEIGFNTEVVSGTSDSFILGVKSLGKAEVSVAPTSNEVAHDITVSGVETLAIRASGSSFVNYKSNDMKALSVTGDGSLKLNEVGTALRTVDASSLTGSLDLDLGETASVTQVKGGSGGDTLRVTTGDLTGNGAFIGGAGTDTLRLSTDATTTVAYALSSVEVLRLQGVANTLNFSGTNSTGIEEIYVSSSAANAVTSTLSELGTTPLAVKFQAGGAVNHTLSIDTTGAVTASVPTSAAAVSAATAETSADNLTLTKATNLTFNVSSFATFDGDIIGNKLTSAKFVVDGALGTSTSLASTSLTSLTVEQKNTSTSRASTIEIDTGTSSTLASITLDIGKGGLDVKTTTSDALTKLETLVIDTDMAFDDMADADELLDSANLVNVSTLTLSGAEDASKVTMDGIGATTLQAPITVTASGLKGNLTLATGGAATGQGIATAANQSITMNIGGLNGATTIGTLAVASTSGTITVNAAGHGDATADTLTIGTISAGTVNVDVLEATGNVTIGAITGTNVTVQATSAQGTVVVNDAADLTTTDITAKTSLTYNGPDLDDQDVAVSITAGSTAFTGALKGGILGDDFVFTSASTGQTSITLTGNLGAGTNTVKVVSGNSVVTTGQTINLSGLTNVTSATITGGVYSDTITGTSGKDTIVGLGGADVLTGNGGNDVFLLERSTAETGTVSATAGVTKADGTTAAFTAGYVITGGERVSTATLDKITDFAIGDTIISSNNGTQVSTLNQFSTTTATKTLTENQDGFITGTYNSSAQTFTFSQSGADTLFYFDADGVGAASPATYGAVVLVGYAASLTTTGTTTGLIGVAAS